MLKGSEGAAHPASMATSVSRLGSFNRLAISLRPETQELGSANGRSNSEPSRLGGQTGLIQ